MEIKPSKWRTRILRSLEMQKHRKDEAARFLRGYTGDYGIKPKKGIDDGSKDEMSVNFIYSFVETVRPTIFPGTPRVFVEGMDEQSEAFAPHYQAVINHWIRVLGLKRELKKCCNDWFYGHAGFLSEWEYEDKLLFEQDEKTPQIDPMTGKQAFEVLTDRPTAKRLDPWDIVLDPDSKSREEDKWRALRVIMSKEEFDLLPGVDQKIKKEITGKAIPADLVRQPVGSNRDGSSENNSVILWRIYDLENETVKLMADGETTSDFVEMIDWPWQFEVGRDRYPITILEGKQDAANPYSFSPFKAYWMQIQERNKLRTMLQSTTRRSAPGWLGKKGAMDEEQKNAFLEAKIGEYTEANNPEGIIPRPLPNMAREFFAHDNQVESDVNSVSGMDEYRNSNDANTATEASINDARSSVRKGENRNDFAEFNAIIFNKIGQLSQQFMTKEAAIKIRMPHNPGELGWMRVNKEHIQGEFELSCKPGFDDAQNESLRRQQDLKFNEMMSNNPWVDQQKLATRMAKRWDIEPDEILKSPQVKQQEEQAQQQAHQAELDAKKKPVDAPIKFKNIDVSLLPPEIQQMITEAGIAQNDVLAADQAEGGVGFPQGAAPGQESKPGTPASPSVAGPTPQNNIMPGAEMNQAPPVMSGQQQPPATPVGPMSENQGGHT